MGESVLVLVHGLFGWGESEPVNKHFAYWGTTAGNALGDVREMGHNVYAASVGPLSGAWYTACELYAQLTGTRVDYGERHAAANGQRRFGRTYDKPLFEGWSEEKKVHVIGHSYGATTVRMFAHLLTHGAPEEVEASGRENVSPLFLGGQEHLLASVTSVCGTLNPTKTFVFANKYKLVDIMRVGIIGTSSLLSRSRFKGKLMSVRFERIGMHDTPGQNDKYSFKKAWQLEKNDEDSIYRTLSTKGLQKINDYVDISPNVPFLSFPFDCLHRKGKLIFFKIKFPMLLSIVMSLFLDNLISRRGIDAVHDGLLELEAAEHPDDEPFVKFDPEKGLQRGVWNVMPITYADHGLPVGLFNGRKATRAYLHELFSTIENEEKKLLESEKSKSEQNS